MILRKLVLVFGFFFVLNAAQQIKAQNNCIGITINEFCASNVPLNGKTDAFGELSDWVELKCNFTSPVSMKGYYLSNDRNNPYKWAFPSTFIMGAGEHRLVWLSGRNTVKNGEYHTNFTIEQCKNQWLILSTSEGAVRDSVFVLPAQGGHTWGRIDCFTTGINAYKLFLENAKSPEGPNSTIYYRGYAPTPKLFVSTETNFTTTPNQGGFYPELQLGFYKLEGRTYDTASFCYDIFYTIDGSYPIPGYPPTLPTRRYIDSLQPIPINETMVIRSLAVPRQPSEACGPGTDVRPSFVESNTYFVDPTHQTFNQEFGVVSLSMDENWLLTGGSTPATVHVEYYDKQKQVSEGYAIINKPPQESWITKQKGFYISIDDRYGSGCNFEGPVFNVQTLGTTTRTLFPTLHLKGGDLESYSSSPAVPNDEVYGTGLRDVFIQSLASKYKLNVNPLHIKPVITFINGAYSGVFNLFETYDKYYENHYNGQPLDSLDLNYVHLSEDEVRDWTGALSSTLNNDWRTGVYDFVINNPMTDKNGKYKTVMERLDKASFIDYMILNSYAQNQDLWKYNVAFGRGHDKSKPGHKWHYYLWNMPSIFNFTTITNGNQMLGNPLNSPCYIHGVVSAVQPKAYDGHGNILALLMGTYPGKTTWGNESFRLEYRNRYQDMMNGPLKCDNILKHYDDVVALYTTEMQCHSQPACEAKGDFHLIAGKEPWDTNVAVLRRGLQARCYSMENQFSKGNCYGLPGPFDLSVDVRPAGAGTVKLNTMMLENYIWYGKYFQTTLSFKAIPTNTNYVFHHWEFSGPVPKDPLSLDSVGVNFNTHGDVVAVFTDKSGEIIAEGPEANVPTAFTPNGDGRNDIFRPLGAAEYQNEYQMTIWNRWGEEVFRSVDVYSGWDGNYKGSMAHNGVYAYVITYKNKYNESKVVKGNVTLTR